MALADAHICVRMNRKSPQGFALHCGCILMSLNVFFFFCVPLTLSAWPTDKVYSRNKELPAYVAQFAYNHNTESVLKENSDILCVL